MSAPPVLQFALLASGSGGNVTLVEHGGTQLIIDAGLSARRTRARAAQVGADLSTLTGIILSHEHGDHIAGAGPLARHFGAPVYASRGTLAAGAPRLGRLGDVRPFEVGEAFRVGSVIVHPFRTPHDVADGCAFVFEAGGVRLGWCMDLGSVTTLVREKLRDCDALILEFNHDERLVREGTRPWPVKQRVLGDHGHLSNEAAAALLADVEHPGLQEIVVAHISRDHNTPDRPRKQIAEVVARRLGPPPRVTVASQDTPTTMFRLRPARAAVDPG